jgi:hypothetical protein
VSDHELDYRVLFECGCVVTFCMASGYRTSRMDACRQHNGIGQTDERTDIVERARARRKEDLEARTAGN